MIVPISSPHHRSHSFQIEIEQNEQNEQNGQNGQNERYGRSERPVRLVDDFEFIRGMLTITVVAFFICVFEFMLFVLVIVPLETDAILGFLRQLKISGASTFMNRSTSIPFYSNRANFVMDTLAAREQRYIGMINMDSVVMCCFMFFLMTSVMVYLHDRMVRLSGDDDASLYPVVLHVLATVATLAVFQYNVFLYGTAFQYPGTRRLDATYGGEEEIVIVLLRKLQF